MRRFLITIAMPDGSRGRHHGLYANGCTAILHALELFPDARYVSARRLP